MCLLCNNKVRSKFGLSNILTLRNFESKKWEFKSKSFVYKSKRNCHAVLSFKLYGKIRLEFSQLRNIRNTQVTKHSYYRVSNPNQTHAQKYPERKIEWIRDWIKITSS